MTLRINVPRLGFNLPAEIAGPFLKGLFITSSGNDDGNGGGSGRRDFESITGAQPNAVRGSGTLTDHPPLSLETLSEEVLRLYKKFSEDFEQERGLKRRLQNRAMVATDSSAVSTLTPSENEWFKLSQRSPDRQDPVEINHTVSYRIVDFYQTLKTVYEKKDVNLIFPSSNDYFGWVSDVTSRQLLIDLLWARTIEFKRADPMPEAINILLAISRAGKNITTISTRELIELIITGKIPLRMER